jgi:clan AA aspartic protease (TIGR02281 family)
MAATEGPAVRSALAVVIGAVPAAVAYATVLGLGLHRHGEPGAVATSATALVFGPALVAVAFSRRARVVRFGAVLTAWSLGVLTAIPVYFPGERTAAFATGVALVGMGHMDDVAERIASTMPAEPIVSRPELPEAAALVDLAPPPPATPLADDQIALPYEGAGRRLSIPVVLEHAGVEQEVWMMLDTGATYTTLSEATLEALGVAVDSDAPMIELHTANGVREARVVLLDRLWLGDLVVEGVAIATCDACASADSVGLLGLNVAGGFNVTIDADRREVVLTDRSSHDRHLDVRPFVELDARLSRFPGGRTEVDVGVSSIAPRPILDAVIGIHCDDQAWSVTVDEIAARGESHARRKLPAHQACERYEVALEGASW